MVEGEEVQALSLASWYTRRLAGAFTASSRMCGGKLFVRVVTILLFAGPIFGHVITPFLSALMTAVGSALVMFWFIGSGAWRQRLSGALWLLLAVWVLTTAVGVSGTLGVDRKAWQLAIAIVLAVMVSASPGWGAIAMKTVTAMLLVPSALTIAFYLVPGAFDAIAVPILSDYSVVGSLDYRSGLSVNRGYNAMYAALGLVMTAPSWMLGVRKKGAWVGPMTSGVFLFALLLADKRSHLFFSLVTLAIVYWIFGRDSTLGRLLFGLGSAVALIYLLGSVSEGVGRSLDRFLSAFTADDFEGATSGRVELWVHALEGWVQHPVAGHGWGTFWYAYPNSTATIAHNQLLNLLFEGGIIALTLFVVAAVPSVTRSFKCAQLSAHDAYDPRFLASTTSFSIQVFLLLYSCTGGELLSQPYTFVPYFLAVALSGSVRGSLEGPTTTDSFSKSIEGTRGEVLQRSGISMVD